METMVLRPEDRELLGEEAAERILATLLRAPSALTPELEATPEVQAYLRDVVTAEARRLGLEPVSDSMGNLVARVGEGARRVVVFAYAMTYPANRMPDAFDGRRIENGDGPRLRGRGASEQKGALTSALMAAALLKQREAELDGQFVLCVSPAGETGRHVSARTFLEGEAGAPFGWCICAVGTDNKIALGNKGRIDVAIRVHGTPAHSSMPWRGLNAVTGAAEVVQRLAAVPLEREHPHLGKATITPTFMRSWPDPCHTVPDEVLIEIDRRLLPGDDPEAAVAEIREALDGLDPYRVEITPAIPAYPNDVPADSPFVDTLRAAFADAGRAEPEYLYSHGCIDAGFFSHSGVPCVMLGPGEQAMWHTNEESVRLADVCLGASVYAAAVLRELGEEGDRR